MKAAIHSPPDPGATLRRANTVLSLYFDPDDDQETRAAIRHEFVVALKDYPNWAVQRAFDAWVKSNRRRPTPCDIVILVGHVMKPLTDELARRERDEADRRETRPDYTQEQLKERRALAEAVLRKPVQDTVDDATKGACREMPTE